MLAELYILHLYILDVYSINDSPVCFYAMASHYHISTAFRSP